ncbi:Deleted in malignant brain tumors 1 protein [Bulinus truncatus]|nr:Deleted in malignant brain tumors 1 protein [Bulinus truncatus]
MLTSCARWIDALIFLFVLMEFSLAQNADCHLVLDVPSGVFTSPNYPRDYDNLTDCSWLIQAPEDTFIILNFTSIVTECGYDFVSVYDGSMDFFPLLGRYCEQPDGIVVASTANSIYVTFTSDRTISREGFQVFYYSMLTHLDCQQTLTSTDGSFQSPYFPFNYSNNADCEWRIEVPEDYIIQLKFTTLLTECFYDYVHLFDGKDSSSNLIGHFCNEPKGLHVVSSSNVLYVSFTSDTAVTSRGFYANYTALPKVSNCQKSFTNLTGYFTSPYYPLHYNNRADCAWLIEVPVGMFISLTFTHLDAECDWDYIVVYDGNSTDARRLGPYCNLPYEKELNLQSSSNTFYVTFISSATVTNTGFEAYYLACEEPLKKY